MYNSLYYLSLSIEQLIKKIKKNEFKSEENVGGKSPNMKVSLSSAFHNEIEIKSLNKKNSVKNRK